MSRGGDSRASSTRGRPGTVPVRKEQDVARQMLTIDEAAKFLGTTPRHLRRLVSDHELSHYKIGGRIRFADVDLDAWLDGQRVDGKADRRSATNVVPRSYDRRRAGSALADRSALR